MNAVWTLAEQSGGKIKTVSYELLTRGRRLAEKLSVPLVSVVFGAAIEDAELKTLIEYGADEVIAVLSDELKDFVCETYSAGFIDLIKERKPAIILAGATSSGRTMMPYTAVKCRTGLTADCTDLDIEEGTGNLLQTRPAIGGNIMATIKTPDTRPQMATVRPKSERPLPRDAARSGKIEKLPLKPGLSRGENGTIVTGCRKEESGGGLDSCDVIVSGGKGLKKGENFTMTDKLVAALQSRDIAAGVGASREAVDRGWVSYPHQVGLSGKTVSPKVYIAVGISGAIQHLAGIRTAETIISVNTDGDAPIGKIADLEIVGDAFRILPALTKAIEAKK